MSIICLKAYRDEKRILEIQREVLASDWNYSNIKARIEARFGDQLPKHFAKAMTTPQKQPYRYGDPHNVAYRTRSPLFNQPMPVPCEVTPESCLKYKDLFILGSRCAEGIDEPFPWMDYKYQTALNFLKSLPNGSKLRIHTRSDLVAHDDYISELKRLEVHVTVLISNLSEDETRRQEPGAPSLKRRKEAVAKLIDCGIGARLWMHELPSKKKGVA